ncbi:MAG: hypothetical protein BGO67_10090 [Alphaproteobacteria bacterium 41-28]|nr:MAG: hypothetical protein BGO67_10090 [Alphaproteobacteria bacterium 41-28]
MKGIRFLAKTKEASWLARFIAPCTKFKLTHNKWSLVVIMRDHPWYLEYKKNPHAAMRLFCFHHSGGGTSAYFPWLEYLSPHIEMIAIQMPGRENRFSEPLTNNLTDIVNTLKEGFELYKDKPFFTFGHSLGGVISFEFIKSVMKFYSLTPLHMMISATKAPHFPFRMKQLSQLGDKPLKEELRAYNGIDERILESDELLELFLPIIKSDFSITESYRSTDSTVLPCDILVFSGNEDPTVNMEEIQGWSSYTTGKFKHISFSGGHFFVKEHQKSIVSHINRLAEQYVQ